VWDGEPCGSDDFEAVPTDYGLCYSFNKISETRQAVETGENAVLYTQAKGLGCLYKGVEGGLRLLINVEQYEYMPGPNSAAGLKLSLHDRHELASVKDHGIAVPTGSHALIGVKITEVGIKTLNPGVQSFITDKKPGVSLWNV
jgi:hypothetical protein